MIAEQCRVDLLSYSKFIKEDYDIERFHDEIAEALMKVYTGEIKRLAIRMPPRSGKSKLACINFPSWVLWLNPYRKIVVAWYSQELVDVFSTECRDIVKSDKYKLIFDTEIWVDKINHRETHSPEDKDRNPDQNGHYHATGISWGLTGFWWDILIIDDPVKNRDEAESVVYRNKVWNRYTSTLSTRFSDDQAAIIVIMTRWHVDDLMGRLENMSIQYQKAGIDPEPWHVIDIPALTVNESIQNAMSIDDKYISFRPSKFSVQYLLEKKIEIWFRDFSALYQQDPISSTGAIFKPSDFRNVKLSDFESIDPTKVQMYRKEHIDLRAFVDPAWSTDADSDDASVAIMGQHRITKEVFLFDLYSGTSAPSQTIAVVFMMLDRWRNRWFDNIAGISCEYVTLSREQTHFYTLIQDHMTKTGSFYTLHKFIPKWKKDDRIKFSLEPIFTNHKLFFMEDQIPYEQMNKLTEQLQQFPNSNKKDVIDVLSQGVIVLRDWGTPIDAPQYRWSREKFNPITGQKMQVGRSRRKVF